ncbi:MAG TPA: hypothetical protein VNE39_17440 [Planctomycetota bacterium]|nr:hypothetical protein [Planctomycetota bacterium]
MGKRQPFDLKSPEAQALRDEIVHGTFVKEGTLVAFPLCFPGCSVPVVADESHVTALDVGPNWMVYGGTSGRAAHLFVGMFHGATGMVLDLGVVKDATHCATICCGTKRFVAFVNGPGGGRAVARALQGLPFDLLQEWGFGRQPLEDLGPVVQGERVLHAVRTPGRDRIVGVTERHLFTMGADAGKPEVVGEVPGAARLAVGSKGSVFGLDEGHTLWRYSPASARLKRRAVRLPEGPWGTSHRQDACATVMWARDPASGRLYTADDEGHLYSFVEGRGFGERLGKTRFAPVGPMAATADGRIYGPCGEGIARFFCYNPATGDLSDLGCAVSVIERRRYGYVFGDAATGRDGQLYFGEDDDLGHLWIYFPRILPRKA